MIKQVELSENSTLTLSSLIITLDLLPSNPLSVILTASLINSFPAFTINAIQQQQNAQYQSMIQSTGLEYQQHLLDTYQLYQKQAIQAFKGYEGIK